MLLMTVCKSCSTPRAWTSEEEKSLLFCSHIICSQCRKVHVISKELKDTIKKELGLPIED